MSVGKNLSEYREECAVAERKMIEVALKHGVQPRCEIMTPEEAQTYIDLGVRHFSIGDQLKKLKEIWISDGSRMRALADTIK
jgi:hypothetical protein